MDAESNTHSLTVPPSDGHATDSVENVKGTSTTGNVDHDIIIVNSGLKWYPFGEFENVKFVARGGFSTIYYATWFGFEIALKCIQGSNELIKEFIAEATLHNKLYEGDGSFLGIVKLYGITRQPETGDYMMVMEWCNNGDMSYSLAGYCHKDLHLGNILVRYSALDIGDLGLSGPINKEGINNNDQVVSVVMKNLHTLWKT